MSVMGPMAPMMREKKTLGRSCAAQRRYFIGLDQKGDDISGLQIRVNSW